jgi:hypothetical protein
MLREGTHVQNKIKKAIIAAITTGIFLPVTAIAKYIVLRKSSEIIPSDIVTLYYVIFYAEL